MNKELGGLKSENRILKSMQKNSVYFDNIIGKKSWLEKEEH